MTDFLQRYREISRKNVYVEEYGLKQKKHLVFSTVPPTQIHYPNPGRIHFCVRNRKKVLASKPISFELDIPTKTDPCFRVFGYNKIYHANTEFKTLSNKKSTSQLRTKWLEYKKIPPELLKKLNAQKKDPVKDRNNKEKLKKQRFKAEEEKKRKKEMRMSKRKLKYKNMDEITKSTMVLQKYCSAWVASKKLKRLRKDLKKRENICRELLKTEEDYVNNLKVLRRVVKRVDFKTMEIVNEMRVHHEIMTEIPTCLVFEEKKEILHVGTNRGNLVLVVLKEFNRSNSEQTLKDMNL